MTPSFSIALCTRDGARHLERQLDSLALQTLAPAELVACDDASRDDTVALIEAFAARAPFPVRVTRNDPPLGASANFAAAFSRCAGEWIAPCDQDDVWEPRKLELLAGAIARRPACVLVFSDLQLIDEHDRPLGLTQWQALGFSPARRRRFEAGDAFAQLARYNVVNGATSAFRASLLPLALPIPAGWVQDEWLALAAAAAGPLGLVEEPLVRYRVHPRQVVGPSPAGLLAQLRHARRRMGGDYFDRSVQRTQAALHRLERSPLPLAEPRAIPLLRERLAHCEARVLLRRRHLARPLLATRELFRGNYSRFGYGWKSYVQDLVPWLF